MVVIFRQQLYSLDYYYFVDQAKSKPQTFHIFMIDMYGHLGYFLKEIMLNQTLREQLPWLAVQSPYSNNKRSGYK